MAPWGRFALTGVLNMKAIGSVIAGGLLACMAMIVTAGGVAAAEADAPGTPADAPAAHGWDHHGDGDRHDGSRPDGDGHGGWRQGGWHHHHGQAHMFRELGLTDAQRASMKSILEAGRPAMKDLHEKLRANFKQLRETAPDDKGYTQLAARVSQENGALTAKMISARSKLYSQCYALLAPIQKTHLAELQAKHAKWTEERMQHMNERMQQMRDGHSPRPDGAMESPAEPAPPLS
jgi:Spy/CpxP family protein refolding chaperone